MKEKEDNKIKKKIERRKLKKWKKWTFLPNLRDKWGSSPFLPQSFFNLNNFFSLTVEIILPDSGSVRFTTSSSKIQKSERTEIWKEK